MALRWTEDQRKMAAVLRTGKTAYQAKKEGLFSYAYATAKAVEDARKAGDTPENFDATIE